MSLAHSCLVTVLNPSLPPGLPGSISQMNSWRCWSDSRERSKAGTATWKSAGGTLPSPAQQKCPQIVPKPQPCPGCSHWREGRALPVGNWHLKLGQKRCRIKVLHNELQILLVVQQFIRISSRWPSQGPRTPAGSIPGHRVTSSVTYSRADQAEPRGCERLSRWANPASSHCRPWSSAYLSEMMKYLPEPVAAVLRLVPRQDDRGVPKNLKLLSLIIESQTGLG